MTPRAERESQLAGNRERGYAIQDQELALGLRSVAVPVFGAGTEPVAAALDVAVSASRHDVARPEGPLLERARRAADEITLRLRAP